MTIRVEEIHTPVSAEWIASAVSADGATEMIGLPIFPAMWNPFFRLAFLSERLPHSNQSSFRQPIPERKNIQRAAMSAAGKMLHRKRIPALPCANTHTLRTSGSGMGR